MLTPRQRSTLVALCGRITPAAARAGQAATLADVVSERISHFTPHHQRRVGRAIAAIGHPALAFLLTGRARTFARLTPELQDRMLDQCCHSRLFTLRLLFTALKRLIVNTWYGLPKSNQEIGYRGPLHQRSALFAWEGPLADAAPVVAARTRDRVRERVVPSGVMEAQHVATDIEITTEFCVIGSGVGGSVAACVLSEAGRDVVMLEAGPYRTAADFPDDEATGFRDLYAEAGMRSTEDLSISMLQGQCAGGGSTVNWMVMLRTPDYVLDEWQGEHGMQDMSPAHMREVFERFEAESGVGEVSDAAHSRANRILLDGARALGWQAQAARINARDCMRAGLCGLGCPYDAKHGMLKTHLARALSAGARLYCDTRADRIENKTVQARTGHGRRVVVRAERILIAAGAIETPALLQRSALGNRRVGEHLRLHPTTAVVGVYDRPVYAGSGIPLSTYCTEFTQLRDDYGHWIETPPLSPGLAAIALPGFGGTHHKQMMQYPFLAPLIVLVRDGVPHDPSRGRVRGLSNGRTRIDYKLSAADRELLLHGMESAARIHFAMGARSVFTLHRNANRLHSERAVTGIRATNARVGDPMLFSAHLNGTCRIAGSDERGACLPTGELRGAPGIYCMDGSLLPTAPGVNPHETIAAVVTVLASAL
jgi:choline dehydrogenase-like flavoprotein